MTTSHSRLALLSLAGFSLIAAAPRSPNLLRDAVSPVVAMEHGKDATLTGRTDDEAVEARVSLGAEGTLDRLALTQGGRELAIAPSALSGVSGTTRGWLEERGALTTLVLEGVSDGKDWRLALAFHDRELWMRRVSREGESKDSFTFYDPDTLRPRHETRRRAHDRGFH